MIPSLFPGYLLLVYQDPGAANFGWEMFLGFFLFWGSVFLAVILGVVNAAVLIAKPALLINRRIALCFMLVTLVPLMMGTVLLLR